MVFLLKLSICWGFFALLYTLLLHGETFFRSNRIYLLGTALAGIVLAAFGDQLLASAAENDLVVITLPVVSAGFQQAEEVSKQWGYMDIVWSLYLLGAVAMFMRLLSGIMRLFQMAAHGSSESLPGACRMIRSESVKTPFSFFKWIFVPADWEQSPASASQQILAHERAHAEGWHSLDIMLMECLCALFWFHPLVHWYRRSLRTVHEYLADAQASRLTDKKQYGLLLIRQSQSGMPVAFANHFFQSPLKQRLIMLMKQNSAPVRALRYGLVLPLAALFVLLFQQAPAIAQEANGQTTVQQDASTALLLNAQSGTQNAVSNHSNCNQPPSFPGGMTALIDFISKNLEYPKMADGSSKEGKVLVGFTVKTDGAIQDVHLKNPSKMPQAFEAEALRVVSMMPNWIPGQKNCKPSIVELTLPIQFTDNKVPTSDSDKVMNIPDTQTPPQFKGGMDALVKYLSENIKYPAAAKQAKAEGTVVVQFIVEKDGSISEAKALNAADLHPEIVSEAIRSVKEMPKWVPGIVDGKIVRVQFALPIKFKLD